MLLKLGRLWREVVVEDRISSEGGRDLPVRAGRE